MVAIMEEIPISHLIRRELNSWISKGQKRLNNSSTVIPMIFFYAGIQKVDANVEGSDN